MKKMYLAIAAIFLAFSATAEQLQYSPSSGGGGGSGTVTTTGSPANGNLAKFSGGTSITNGNISGDCTTTDTLAITCTKTSGSSFGTSAIVNTGTSGTTIPLLNGANTWSGLQTTSAGIYQSAGAAEEANFSNGNSGTSKALNNDNGNLQSVTITGAVAMTLTTPTHPGKALYIITQDGSGHVYSIAGCKWAGGTALTYSTAASAVDVIAVIYSGTSFYCSGGAAFS